MHDTPAPSGDDTPLLDTVRQYRDSHDRHDTDVALSAFAPDAAVCDAGKEFHGTDEIRTWLTTAASEYTCVAGLGALIAWRYLPARGSEQLSEDDESNEHALVGSSSR